jgi:hypothetical protein
MTWRDRTFSGAPPRQPREVRKIGRGRIAKKWAWRRPTSASAAATWKTFLAAHWDGLATADFFTVEVLTMGGLVRYVIFFVMKLKTRAEEIAGIGRQPDEVWMTQVARNLP